MASHTACCGISFWIYILIIVGLVLFAGMMSGLTLGLMSLGLVDLEVLMRSGTPEDRKHAAKILPVVRNQHLLLCTLLIGNALAMEALPIFLDSLVAAWGAILISVTLILMFGEIFPQAICTRYGLAVGAFMSPFVRVLVMFFFPVSYPISKLLDKLLGKGHVALFRRAELKTLVNMHGNEAGKGGELTHDETTIIAGALELTEKTAVHAMTPVSEIFAVDVNTKLNMEMMNLIMEKGHSRLPIYSGSPSNIIGLILVKNLLAIRAQDEVPVRNLTIRKIPRIPESMPLYDILNEFQKGHSHMAVVVKYSKEKSESMLREGSNRRLSARRHSRHPSDAKGVGTYMFSALDIPEGEAPPSETGSPQKRPSVAGSATPDHNTLPSNLAKVSVVNIPNPGVTPVNGSPGRLISQRSIGNEATGLLPGRLISQKSNANEAPTGPTGRLISQRSNANEAPTGPAGRLISQRSTDATGLLPGRLISQRSIGNETTGLLPGRLIPQKSIANEAPTGPGRLISQQSNANEAPTGPPRLLTSQKSRKVREAPEAILDTTKESLLSFPNDEQVVGIITMEDLIEELLQEEIWDETDEYIDVHNKIKVNLLPPEEKSPASAPLSSPPPTAASSFPHTPTPTSPQMSPGPQAPVTTPTWSSGPGSPLVNLTGTAGSHHPQLKTLLQDGIKVPPVVEEERPN